MVLVLSTAPCFIEDKCLDLTEETADGQAPDNDDYQCCSPFLSCKTCVGIVLISFHHLVEHSIKQTEKERNTIPTPPISDFPDSIWHPPKLA